ncbi:prefoldin subunit [Candidatus Woesearchaeota archaeon]|nr:prefoldin subunit [Candidatus Woesearchaeota archaeon]
MDKETEQKINQLTMIEQSMHQLLSQKQGFQAQLMEVESALSELDRTDKAYRIVGNIMVAADKKPLKEELGSKQDILNLRIKNIEKQENSLKDKAKSVQTEVMETIRKEKK